MLRELSIENLAVIEKASIAFDDKLNVFTGETGAGKSILIGGINAILGGRILSEREQIRQLLQVFLTICRRPLSTSFQKTVFLSRTSFYCSVIYILTEKALQE
mgnify:CR=1 FL=1